MDEGKMQRVDYVWMSYNSIHGISGYSLSIFDLEIYPILRLEQQEHEGSALAILNLLGYSYEPYPHNCSYERSVGSIDGKYYTIISRWYLTGDSSCSMLEHTMFVWVLDGAYGGE
ncbi:MAG: hypothetical protein QXP41_06715 [Candidatus Nitrosocaldus sp.]